MPLFKRLHIKILSRIPRRIAVSTPGTQLLGMLLMRPARYFIVSAPLQGSSGLARRVPGVPSGNSSSVRYARYQREVQTKRIEGYTKT